MLALLALKIDVQLSFSALASNSDSAAIDTAWHMVTFSDSHTSPTILIIDGIVFLLPIEHHLKTFILLPRLEDVNVIRATTAKGLIQEFRDLGYVVNERLDFEPHQWMLIIRVLNRIYNLFRILETKNSNVFINICL